MDEAFYRENISGRANAEIVENLLPNLSARQGREISETKEASFRERAVELESHPGSCIRTSENYSYPKFGE